MAIRLATEETKTISDTIYGFDKNAAIFLFGSITDESKKRRRHRFINNIRQNSFCSRLLFTI